MGVETELTFVMFGVAIFAFVWFSNQVFGSGPARDPRPRVPRNRQPLNQRSALSLYDIGEVLERLSARLAAIERHVGVPPAADAAAPQQ